jgi:outer membrane lipoprotein-sorting protein
MNTSSIHIVILSFLTLFFSLPARSSDPDAESILQKVKENFELVDDYKAEVTIKVDVDFVKIPDKQGTVYFMQPDNLKVRTKGFSLLPKRGMNITPQKLLGNEYTALWVRTEDLNGIPVEVIKVIPVSTDGDVIISTLWVDPRLSVIRQLEATTRNEGTFMIELEFGRSFDGHTLPKQVKVDFDLRKNEIPLGLTGDFEGERSRDPKPKNSRGSVTITYHDYEVNKGAGESVFRKRD